MKTAEEWIEEFANRFEQTRGAGSIIKAIQLDARKQGMLDAAEIVGSDAILQMESHVWGKLAIKKQDILDAANNLKEI